MIYKQSKFTAKETKLGMTKGKVYDCKIYDHHVSWIEDSGKPRFSKRYTSDAYKRMEFKEEE